MSNINYTQLSNDDIIEIVNEIDVKNNCLNRKLKSNHSELLDDIKRRTSFLDNTFNSNKISIFLRLHCIKNNLTSVPTCHNPNCSNHVSFKKGNFTKYCSIKCLSSDEDVKLKRRTTCKRIYGGENPMSSNEVRNKIRETCIERFGVEHPQQTDVVKEKIKKTNIAKYGVENVFQANEVKEKITDTNIERFGVDNVSKCELIKQKKIQTNNLHFGVDHTFQSKEIKEQIRNTNLKNLGVEFPMQSKDVQEKSKQTCISKYGCEYSVQSEEVKDKIRESTVDKYGVDCVFKSQEIRDKIINTLNTEYGVSNPFENGVIRDKITFNRMKSRWDDVINSTDRSVFPLVSFDYYLNHRNEEFKWKCKKCGTIFSSKISGNWWKVSNHSDYARCPTCHPYMDASSGAEHEISNFIQTICQNVVENDRTVLNGKELDIYIPEKKLAFEYDGLFWHSEENGKDKNYHTNKTNECERQGIQLIHIFENEWLNKQDIVKSRIKNLLGVYDKTIYARKCEVKEVSSNESFEFQNQNHIQGGVHSSVNLGLYFDNELVSLMTFAKPRFSKKYEWELVRFCNKLGYHVPGGASKLLKHFERNYNPKSLVSYADRRWSKGNLYEKLGFKLNSISSPNYWYFNDDRILESRVKYQKHKLKNMLPIFDESKSEVENMKDNGYNRIFDCGNLVYVKHNIIQQGS